MRRAIAEAEVGDEQLREDPTVNRLQDTVAALLGKEAALFLPSGTMCNQIAFAVHCRPGDEILLHETAHPMLYEAGGAAATVGAIFRPLPGPRGMFTAEQVRAALRPRVHYMPRSRVVSIEQTANIAGRSVLAARPDRSRSAPRRARRGWPVTWTVPGSSTRSSRAERRPAPSPPRSTRSGSTSPRASAPRWAPCWRARSAFIEEAWVYKQRYGGAMRQAGILAAAGLYALEHHVERLAEDHERARRLARGLAEIRGIGVDADRVDTNIVIFDVSGPGIDGEEFARRALASHEVRFTVIDPKTMRAVFHLDVPEDGVERALAAARAAAKS